MVVALLLCMLTVSASAQVFFMKEDDVWNCREDREEIGYIPVLPQNTTDDWVPGEFVPIGEGVMLLTLFGGAYLLKKRKKKG